jgi:hypothetical protein
MPDVTAAEVVRFCAQREVDLRLRGGQSPFTVDLHGEFDGYGDFFSILCADVEYVDCPGVFTIGGLIFVQDCREVLSQQEKWRGWLDSCSGPGFAMWEAGEENLRTARASSAYVVVANRIVLRSGADWEK